MQFFDAHNHLNDELLAENWQQLAEQATAVGVVGMVVNGGDLAGSKRAVMMADELDFAYAAVGIHPEDLPLKESLANQVEELKLLAQSSDKVVAIGELGLDYTLETGDGRQEAGKLQQFELIEPQLALADELGLPVVLHVRDQPGQTECFADMISMLDNFPGLRGQFHCWTGSLNQMEQAVERGFYISFSGILTYGSAGHIVEVAQQVPQERLLVETDAPYLVPEPQRTAMRKQSLRNTERLCLPEYVTMTTEKLAELRQKPLAEMAEITTTNAQQLFLVKTA